MIGPESISGTTKCTVAPCIFAPGVERALVRVEALERRQQRRVDIEQAPLPLRDETGREQPHEAGETNDVDAVLHELGLQRALERRAVLAELRVIDDFGRDACGARDQQPAGVRLGWTRTSAISAG